MGGHIPLYELTVYGDNSCMTGYRVQNNTSYSGIVVCHCLTNPLNNDLIQNPMSKAVLRPCTRRLYYIFNLLNGGTMVHPSISYCRLLPQTLLPTHPPSLIFFCPCILIILLIGLLCILWFPFNYVLYCSHLVCYINLRLLIICSFPPFCTILMSITADSKQ